MHVHTHARTHTRTFSHIFSHIDSDLRFGSCSCSGSFPQRHPPHRTSTCSVRNPRCSKRLNNPPTHTHTQRLSTYFSRKWQPSNNYLSLSMQAAATTLENLHHHHHRHHYHFYHYHHRRRRQPKKIQNQTHCRREHSQWRIREGSLCCARSAGSIGTRLVEIISAPGMLSVYIILASRRSRPSRLVKK